MLTLNDLLSTYDACAQQRTSDVTEQLARLRQEIETKRLSIERTEIELLQAQQHCLNQMRPHFEVDARAVLKTPQFAAFIDFLVESGASDRIGSAHSLLIAPSPTFWLLPSTSIALHLRDIENLQRDNPDGTDGGAVVQLQVAINDWQQLIHVSTEPLRQQCQITAILDQIQCQFPRAEPDDAGIARLYQVVAQELACVVLFVARLFSLDRITAINEGFEL